MIRRRRRPDRGAESDSPPPIRRPLDHRGPGRGAGGVSAVDGASLANLLFAWWAKLDGHCARLWASLVISAIRALRRLGIGSEWLESP